MATCNCTTTTVNGETIHALTCALFDGVPLGRHTPSIGDVTIVDRWNHSTGAWDQVRLVWNGTAYVKK